MAAAAQAALAPSGALRSRLAWYRVGVASRESKA
jgi:hypothetical protein